MRNDKAARKKISLALKKRYASGLTSWNKGLKTPSEVRKKMRLSNIKSWSSVSLRKKQAIIEKKAYENYSLRKKIDKIVTNWWKEHPNIKKAYSSRMKKYYIANPLLFKQFLQGGKNANRLKYKTKAGYMVRSHGEEKIADYLFSIHVNALYEAKVLRLDGWLCVPDFFIPKYKTYIEFYGGHPKSYQKKVLKNKLYRKYKIDVISITPSEINCLGRALSLKRFIRRR